MKEKQIPVPMKDESDYERIITDPFGSYTGRSAEKYEKPVQDADDL